MNEKKQRILLIEPPFYRLYNINASLNKFPLSLSYLAGVITQRKPEWHVKIYNSDFSPLDVPLDLEYIIGPGFDHYVKALNNIESPIWQKIKSTIIEFNPTVVGISVKSQNFAAACIVSKIVKSLNKDTLVVLGGPHPSIARTEILKKPEIDLGVFGEGEETIIDILDYADGNLPLSSINGIVYRDGDKPVENPARELISDLDALPFPVSVAKTCLIDYEKFPQQAFKYLFSIRGCANNCSFCGSRNIWSRKVRFRSVENIIEEIKQIQKTGINYVQFDDDTFGVKKSFIKKLCNAMKTECPGLNWSCEIHVNLVDDETIGVMKSAGCRSIMIGVESGNNEILKEIRKDITIEEALTAAQTIKRHKIYLQTFFIVGYPQETHDSLNDTINAMTTFPADIVVYSIFTPYFGTELFDYCKKQGSVSDDFDPSLYNHQSPENYFCPNIPKDVFKDRVRKLEKTLDKINSRRKLKMYLSREGYLKMRERGFVSSFLKLIHFIRNALQSG